MLLFNSGFLFYTSSIKLENSIKSSVSFVCEAFSSNTGGFLVIFTSACIFTEHAFIALNFFALTEFTDYFIFSCSISVIIFDVGVFLSGDTQDFFSSTLLIRSISSLI